MSIAVSAVVLPSRLLLAMIGAMCVTVAIIGVAVAVGHADELPLVARALIAASCVFAAGFGFYHGIGSRKPIHIDISGTGEIRLAEMSATNSCKQINWPHLDRNGDMVRLLESSTVWSYLLLLRLQDDSGKITTLPILPDCVSQESFRALSVACLWIAARGGMREHKNT